jgi:hypothetical protein
MLGHGTKDALRTDKYIDDLILAAERGADDVPVDADVDPAVPVAARHLRAELTRVHPSFHFEEALADRLAEAAGRLRAGLPFDTSPISALSRSAEPARLMAFPAPAAIAERDTAAPAGQWRAILPAAAFRRIPEVASRPSRPLIMGGVGVASAAISIGAVYVAWRHTRPTSGRMGRAVRAAHDRSAGSGRNRRSGATHGIFGVLS